MYSGARVKLFSFWTLKESESAENESVEEIPELWLVVLQHSCLLIREESGGPPGGPAAGESM